MKHMRRILMLVVAGILILHMRDVRAAEIRNSGRVELLSGETQEIVYRTRDKGVMKLQTIGIAGKVYLQDSAGKRISPKILVSSEKNEMFCFGVNKNTVYRIHCENTASTAGTIQISVKKKKSAKNRTKKKARMLPYYMTKSGFFLPKDKKAYWYKIKLTKREYLKLSVLGDMSGKLNINVYKKSGKRIKKATVSLIKQDDTGLVESKGKLKKGTYYIKVACGKECSGEFIIRNQCSGIKTQLNRAMMKYVNNLRKKNDRTAVFWDKSLEKACILRADELTSKFSHTRPNGKSWLTAFDYNAKGENISTATATQSAYTGWLHSPGHKKLMLVEVSDQRTVIGYGFCCAKSAGGSVMAIRVYYGE